MPWRVGGRHGCVSLRGQTVATQPHFQHHKSSLAPARLWLEWSWRWLGPNCRAALAWLRQRGEKVFFLNLGMTTLVFDLSLIVGLDSLPGRQ